MNTEVLFFADNRNNSGFGHISRCFSIAQSLKRRGVNSILFTEQPVYLIATKDKKIQNCVSDWINIKTLSNIVKPHSVVIIDSYLAKKSIYSFLYKNTKLLISFDDNNRIEYTGGIVINGNIYAGSLKYPKNNNINYLLNLRYIPLRKEFWTRKNKTIRKNISSVLITTGGNDNLNCIPTILKLLSTKYPRIKKYILVTDCFNNIKNIKSCLDQHSIIFHQASSKKINNLMYASDLAISGGGQTIYELASIGVPTIAMKMSHDQDNNISFWRKTGFLETIPPVTNELTASKLERAIINLTQQKERFRRKKIGRDLIDGQGSSRIADIIYEKIR